MNKEPLLVISVELNLSYRPQIVIYKDSNIDSIVEHFILEHDLKPSAIGIIKQLIVDNLKGKSLIKNQKNYTEWKSNHKKDKEREKDKEKEKEREKQKIKQKTHERKREHSKQKENEKQKQNLKCIKNHSKRQFQSVSVVQSLCEIPFTQLHNKSSQKCQELFLCDVQKQYQKQLKKLKHQRRTNKQQQQLKQIYKRLIKQNPAGVQFITPEYIDFSSFNTQFLGILQQFFEILKENDFEELNFVKFKQLILKYNYKDLFKIRQKFT